MREIKFRGYYNGDDITGREPRWLHGDLYHRDSGEPMIREPRTANFIAVLPDTVGQYTGLKDRDGNEIYEGDIVKSELRKQSFVVRWGNDYGCWYLTTHGESHGCGELSSGTIKLLTLTVIGNTHDNPELLIPKKQ